MDNPPGRLGHAEIDPHGETDFMLGVVVPEGVAFGKIEVWGHNLTVESDSVISFDTVLMNGTDRVFHPPVHFLITGITPPSVYVLNPDILPFRYDSAATFDFSDDIGGDAVWIPGEATAPVKMKFHVPEPMSFSMGFRVEVGTPIRLGSISGIVFNDLNGNGLKETSEPGIGGVTVTVNSAPGESAGFAKVRYDRTNERGHYAVGDLEAGLYTVEALPRPEWRSTTPNPLLVTLIELPDGRVDHFTHAHFGFDNVPAPEAEVLFGPLPVGPMSPHGGWADTSFVVHEVDCTSRYFLNVVPPPILGPWPMIIDTAEVWINQELVFLYICPRDVGIDTLSYCPPPLARPLLEPGGLIQEGENTITMHVVGNEWAVLLFSVERDFCKSKDL
jgi:hypothetical protein